MNKIVKQIIIIAITAVMSSVLTFGYVIANNFSLEYAKNIIKNNFYGEIDMKKLNEGAIEGMVYALNDENTSFISSDYGYDAFAGELTGEFTGIGISIITNEDGRNSVVKVYAETPAETAGLKSGDVILEVDGENVEFSTVNEIANAVRGEVGTSVNIKADRTGEILSFDIKREKIYIPTVFSKTFENFGYIQVTSFDEKTDEKFKEAVEKLAETDGIIIDLRNNTGGLLDTAINMLDVIINEGTLINTKYNNSEMVYTASGKQIYSKPVVVLVNEYSASASEFFAAAVKENNRGEIVGVNTYGKGSIQTTFKLPGNSGIHLTIGNFYSPKGNKIHKVGVAPSYEVENPEEYLGFDIELIPFEADLQLQKALEVIKIKK